jgi:phosphatidylglycerol:prolipoprotein diacylglycerol transferase
MRTLPVHPAQLYSSVDGILLAILLNAYFYRRRRHGTVVALLFIFYPIMRVIEEIIRSDNPHDTIGLTISQFVSLVLFAMGVAMLLWLRKQPLRSPKAVPFVPAWAEETPRQPAKSANKRK